MRNAVVARAGSYNDTSGRVTKRRISIDTLTMSLESWQDKLIEAFSDSHDYLGGQLTGLYDKQGNIVQTMTPETRWTYDNVVTVAAIPVAALFAAAELAPPGVWQAVSLLIKGLK